MCGINGYIQFQSNLKEEQMRSKVNTMNNEIIHRGPDEEGIYVDNYVGLGMRRLSIIDLTSGKQPIYNEDKTKVIVFNGEVYNFKSLKVTLEKKGHKFITKSDTEVVLHAYEEYGKECLRYFDGMFAFAIYDLITKEVFIARDRIGEKPLYYYKDSGFLIFGSELKSLFSTGLIKKEINKIALSQFLQLTYIPAPLSIIKNVYKLEAASYMVVKGDGETTIGKYWDIEYDNNNLITDYNTCKKLLREAVFNSVEDRMISDVPLGAFLSGGIDSSTIVGVMSKLSDKPINTFTIGFKIKEYDESSRAQRVSEHFKTNHHIHFLDYEEAFDEVNIILNQLDEPFADSSVIPTYLVSKYASKYVKTVLTGDAGDELFAGYSKYLIGYYSDMYNKVPKFIRKSLFEKFLYSIPDKSAVSRKVRKVVENSNKDRFSQRKELMCLGFKAHELNELLIDDSIGENLDFIREYYDKYESNTNEISQTQYTDLKVVLEGDMLVKTDRMSMLSSIETRVPLLSKEIVELAAKIPSEYKINNKNQKIILKETFKDIIPNEILKGTKSGFGVPIDYWFRGPLKKELLSLLDEDYIKEQNIFRYAFIRMILDEHFTGKRNRKSELWALFVFQRWYRRYFSI